MIRMFLRGVLNKKYIINNLNLLKINYIIISIMYIFSAIMLIFLPSEMPMQWDFSGNVNYKLPSILGVWVVPTILLISNFILIKQKKVNVINTCVYIIASTIYIFTYISLI